MSWLLSHWPGLESCRRKVNPPADPLEMNREAPVLQDATQVSAELRCLAKIVQLIEGVDWNKATYSSCSSQKDL